MGLFGSKSDDNSKDVFSRLGKEVKEDMMVNTLEDNDLAKLAAGMKSELTGSESRESITDKLEAELNNESEAIETFSDSVAQDEPRSELEQMAEETAVITAGLVVSGDLDSVGSIDVFGTVEGNVACCGKLTVSGTIEGAIMANEVFANNAKSRNDMSAEELTKLREIIEESALNDPATLPKPILNKLIDKAVNDKVWSDEDIATYEEHKSNMQYLFNFLSKEAASQLAELALADRANIAADKIFNGLVEGRVSKQLKEICLMDQVYVKAEDGKQSVSKYIAEVGKAAGSPFTIKKFVRFEVGEGLEKKNEDFAAEVAAQLK